MRIVFMGTPTLAATVLNRLADEHDVVGVYSRPDAVRGRGKKLVASPVKTLAQGRGIPVYTPTSLRDEAVQDELSSLHPDAICVVAYGALLPREVLEIPVYGCLNVHTSLLPRWRGAAPMQRAILERDEYAGVCIMRMEEGLDTGAFCKRVEIALDELYLADLEQRLACEGTNALLEALDDIESGNVTWHEQGDEDATYAPKILKGELDLDPEDGASSACAKVRASSAAHPARAVVADRSVTVVRASVARDEAAGSLTADLHAGDAVFRAKRFFIMADDGPIELEEVKPDGKKNMDARSFAAGIQGIKNTIVTWGRA